MHTAGIDWTHEQIQQIADDYWRFGSATCPSDQTPLKIQKDMSTAKGRISLALCPRCQRSAAGIE